MDYLWNGTTTAQNQCQKIANNFEARDPSPSSIGDDYSYTTGAQTSNNHNAAFEGPAGDGAMVNSANQSWLNSEYADLKGLAMGSQYYGDAHKVLALMVQNGIFTDPCATGPTPTPSNTGTPTPSSTPTNTPTPTNTSTLTGTPTLTATKTATATATATFTYTLTYTPTSTTTQTPRPTITLTPTYTFTGQPTDTPTNTPTFTPTWTVTSTPTDTYTGQPTNTTINSPTATPNSTLTLTPTAIFTSTLTNIPQWTSTFTVTATLPQVPATSTPTVGTVIVISPPYPNPNYGSTVAVDVSGMGLSVIKWDGFTAAFRKIKTRSVPASTFNHLVWDLMDVEGSPISDGIYYFWVEADGVNGKTVVIKKVLVLR